MPQSLSRSTRLTLLIGGSVLILAAALLLLLAAFPWGALRGTIEHRLSRDLGRPVTIGSLERTNAFSFHPLLVARDIRAPQAAWAGGGDLARIAEVRIRFAALHLLRGNFQPEAVSVRGARLVLVRDANGRESWRTGPKRDTRGPPPGIRTLDVADTVVDYRDAKRGRSFTANLSVTPTAGLRVTGTGLVKGEPVTLAVTAAPLAEADLSKPWPFRAAVTGEAVGVTLDGRMDHPLDIGHFTAAATAHGRDLALVDAIVEAGLPRTQPVELRAEVRRDRPNWRITKLAGTVGTSDVAGEGTVEKRGDRHFIAATLTSRAFNFDDLSSELGRKRAAAKRAIYGRRVVPDTAIDLTKLARTDGLLKVHADRLVWPGPSPFAGLDATIRLDRSLLTVEPLRLRLLHGTMTGRLTVEQRTGGPHFAARLTTSGARLADFIPDSGVDADLRGHIRLAGTGKTVRAAIGRSTGDVAFVSAGGTLPARTASLLGQDIGGALFGKKDELATLRCAVIRLDAANGRARAAPIVIDTSRAQTRIAGAIDLASEAMALSATGAPKHDAALRLTGAIPIGGTMKEPKIELPKDKRGLGGALKILGRALGGDHGPVAQDADCAALATAALR